MKKGHVTLSPKIAQKLFTLDYELRERKVRDPHGGMRLKGETHAVGHAWVTARPFGHDPGRPLERELGEGRTLSKLSGRDPQSPSPAPTLR
jgi:hypothetical protein